MTVLFQVVTPEGFHMTSVWANTVEEADVLARREGFMSFQLVQTRQHHGWDREEHRSLDFAFAGGVDSTARTTALHQLSAHRWVA